MLFIINSNKLNINQKLASSLFVFLPIFLITGPFLSDLAVSILAIYFLFNIKTIKFNFNNKIFILFLFFYLAIILNSFNFEYYLESLKSFFFYFRFIFFIIVISFLINKEEKIIYDFIKILLFAVAIVCISAFFEYLTIRLEYFERISQLDKEIFEITENTRHLVHVRNTTEQRISGIFGEEKILGSYLLKLFPMIFGSYLFINKNKILKLKNYVFLLLLIFVINSTIIISGDRAPFILFAFQLFLMFLFLKKFRKFLFFTGAIALLATSIIILTDPVVKERVINVTFSNIKGEYNDNKMTLITKDYEGHLKAAIIIFNNYPLLGSGIKGFRNQCFNTNLKDVDGVKCSNHPHNIFFQILSETGILGVIIYLYLFFYIIKNLISNIRIPLHKDDGYHISSKIIYLINFIIILWPVTTSGSFFNNYNTIFYCLPIILYIGIKK